MNVNKLKQKIKHLAPLFMGGRAFFLTVKHPKYQKLDKINKMLYKISETYIIIREKNKVESGYHFHALFTAKTAPKRNWFRKGVHINICELGKKQNMTQKPPRMMPNPIWNPSYAEILGIPCDIEQKILFKQKLHEVLVKKLNDADKKSDKIKNIDNVLSYMCKEFTQLTHYYVDFVVKIRKKTLPPPNWV